MRLFAAVLLAPLAWGANCVPIGQIRPAGSVQGTLSEANCRLSDGTAFAEYVLYLPTQGEIDLRADAAAFPVNLLVRDSSGRKLADGAAIRRTLERGEYSVAVNTAEAAKGGAFTLRSAFTPEPNTLCRTARPLGVGTSVGRLGASSCKLPDQSAYDAYQVSPLAPGSVEISLDTQDFESYLALRNGDGRALAVDTRKIVLPIKGDEDYTVIAAAATPGSGGDYKLTVTFTPSGDDPCQPQRALQASQDVRGAITDAGCRFGGELRFQFYPLKIAEPGVADLRMSSPDLTGSLALLDADGRLLALDSASGGSRLPILRPQLNPGDYTVLVLAAKPGGEYTLQYRFRPGLPEICPVLTLDPGVVATGSLDGVSSCRGRDGLEDVYRFTLSAPGTLELAMSSGDFDSLLILRDAKDHTLVGASGFSAAALPARILADLGPGAYSVAAAAGAPGGYSTAYSFTPRDLPPCVPRQLALNSALIGGLGPGPCPGSDGQPADAYEFSTPSDGVAAAFMTSPDVDSHLTLSDADGKPLRQDDNTFGDTDAMLIQFLPSRTYRLTARSAVGGQTGLYRLDLLYSPGDRPPGCLPLRQIAPGDSLRASLGIASCQWADDTFADIYALNVADSTPIDITLTSARFDAFLVLLDSKGNAVDLDDDSGGGSNARIARDLDPGVYFIVAKSFGGNGYAAGEYTISVR